MVCAFVQIEEFSSVWYSDAMQNYSNVMIDFIGVCIALSALLIGRQKERARTQEQRLFQAQLILVTGLLLLDQLGWSLNGYNMPGLRALCIVINILYHLTRILFCWIWVQFSDLWNFALPERLVRRRLIYLLPLIAEVMLLIGTPWTGWVFTITLDNVYLRGDLYYVHLIPYILYSTIVLTQTIRCSLTERGCSRQESRVYLIYIALPLVFSPVEYAKFGTSLVWPFTAVSLLMIRIHQQQNQLLNERLSVAKAAENAARMSAEMANSRMAIMLSQIQPHFLYNALCVIQDLCHGKAPEAEQATIAFSRFLRGNLDSLNAVRPIPFSEEIGHTQYYLTLEKMRFGARLHVEYDLRIEAFLLPAMTLQPIVENAVRYGVMQREEGGTVRISSEERANGYAVTVQDDGVGFDPSQKHADGRTHVGIDNVRQRLREMCGGELTIISTPGKGTTATIFLPKKEKAI